MTKKGSTRFNKQCSFSDVSLKFVSFKLSWTRDVYINISIYEALRGCKKNDPLNIEQHMIEEWRQNAIFYWSHSSLLEIKRSAKNDRSWFKKCRLPGLQTVFGLQIKTRTLRPSRPFRCCSQPCRAASWHILTPPGQASAFLSPLHEWPTDSRDGRHAH